jgi:hypothetical protein
MLYSMSAAFSADEMDLGRTNIVASYIDFRDKEPVYTQQFRLPMEQIKFIKENVMGWLDAGIVKKKNHRTTAQYSVCRRNKATASDASLILGD